MSSLPHYTQNISDIFVSGGTLRLLRMFPASSQKLSESKMSNLSGIYLFILIQELWKTNASTNKSKSLGQSWIVNFQAKYCNPPARNFIGEKLLECLQRRCRFDFQGCEFISSSSDSLVNHEQRCSFRPTDFKIIKKHNLYNSSRNYEMCIVEILQLLSRITVR